MDGSRLAKVTVRKTEKDRGTVKLGDKRLLDVVRQDGETLIEFKEKHGGVIQASADDLVGALRVLVG